MRMQISYVHNDEINIDEYMLYLHVYIYIFIYLFIYLFIFIYMYNSGLACARPK